MISCGIGGLDPDDFMSCENENWKSEYTSWSIDEMTKKDGLYFCNECNLESAYKDEATKRFLKNIKKAMKIFKQG